VWVIQAAGLCSAVEHGVDSLTWCPAGRHPWCGKKQMLLLQSQNGKDLRILPPSSNLPMVVLNEKDKENHGHEV
jgi:hypothetical protein